MYKFPKAKFADENTVVEQIDHLYSEIEECLQALDEQSKDLFHLAEEIFDVSHSAETALRIIESLEGPEFLRNVKYFVIAKNADRGYYPSWEVEQKPSLDIDLTAIENEQRVFAGMLKVVMEEMFSFLLEKNAKYGNSCLEPLRVFSKSPTDEQINVRMDDKLSRIAQDRVGDDEDPELDLLGYLLIKKVWSKLNGAYHG
jgi:hypothetical protein